MSGLLKCAGGSLKHPREEISEFLDPRTVALKSFCPFWLI